MHLAKLLCDSILLRVIQSLKIEKQFTPQKCDCSFCISEVLKLHSKIVRRKLLSSKRLTQQKVTSEN